MGLLPSGTMDDATAERRRPPSLLAAIRAARLDGAERAQATGDLRDAELARLDLLREMLDPVLAEIPPEIDLFDTGVAPGPRPRLFIDMIAFVEMGHDRRTYRLFQDRRDGRVLLAEADGVGAMVAAVTDYIARRLVERERLLASLDRGATPLAGAVAADPPRRPPPPPRRNRALRAAALLLRFILDGLGLAALVAVVWLGVRYAHGHLPGWWLDAGLPRP